MDISSPLFAVQIDPKGIPILLGTRVFVPELGRTFLVRKDRGVPCLWDGHNFVAPLQSYLSATVAL